MDKLNTQITVCHSLLLLFLVVSGWCDIQEEMGSNFLSTTIIPVPNINLSSVTYPTILTSDIVSENRNYLTQLVKFINTLDSIGKVKNLTFDEKHFVDEIIADSKLSSIQLKPDEQKQTIQQNGQRNSQHNYHQLKDGIYNKPMANNNQKLSSSEKTVKEQQKSDHETKEEHNHTEEESGEKEKKKHDEMYHSDLYQRNEQQSNSGDFKSGNKNQKQRIEKGYFREYHKDDYKKLDKFFSNHHVGGEYNKYGIVKENDHQNGNSIRATNRKYNHNKIKGFKKIIGEITNMK